MYFLFTKTDVSLLLLFKLANSETKVGTLTTIDNETQSIAVGWMIEFTEPQEVHCVIRIHNDGSWTHLNDFDLGPPVPFS